MDAVTLSLPLLLPLLAPAPQDPGADAVAALREAEAAVQARWAQDDLLGALETGAEAARAGAARLAAAEPGAEADRLADELELLLVALRRVASPLDNPRLLAELLGDVAVDPHHGAAHAALAWLLPEAPERLGLLVRWEFIGPFDNERGAALQRRLGPEDDPDPERTFPGKVRPVGWRALPELPPAGGMVRFARLIEPREQVAVLARSWVFSPDARQALLLLGVSEEVRVWHGGAPVFEALGEHELRGDSLAVPLALEPGWNELALLVGGGGAAPRFTARLAGAERGEPLLYEQRSRAPEGTAERVLAAGDPPAVDPAERPGAFARWRASGEDGAEAHYRRALLEVVYRPRPSGEHPGRAAAARAVELAPDVQRYRLLYAETLRDRAAGRAERDVNPWLHQVRALLERDPDLPRALLWEALHAWQHQDSLERALERVDRALVANPDSLQARSLRVRLLGELDQDGLAAAEIRGLLAHPRLEHYPALLLDYADTVPSPAPERLERYERVIAANGDPRAFRRRAEQLALETRDRGAESSLETLGEILSRDPWNVAARLATARELLARDHPREALAVLDDAIEMAPEHAVLHRYRARVFLQLGDAELAALALERELELDFSAADERRLLEHLRAAAGEPFHVAWQEPLEDVLARVGDEPLVPGASREVLLRRVVVEVHPDGTAKRYFRLVERVAGERGARELDRFGVQAAPGEQEARLLTASVRRPDGSVELARTGRSGRRGGVGVDLPPLDEGDVVDLEWRLDDLRPTFFGRTFGLRAPFAPDPGLPVHESELVLSVPDELPLVFHQRGFEAAPEVTRVEPDSTLYRWRLEDLEPLATESLMPPAEELVPLLEASSYASWEELGTWWWNLIEEEIRVSPEMAAEVARLTEGRETPLEKLRAIYDFVVTDIRYNAWEFGVHGYQPYSAPVIFSRRFGDCKDKAILLRAMLSEVGIEAYPVLIRATERRPEEDHSLALVQHFNHCIAWVPEQEGLEAAFLDGTARYHPLEVLPAMDRGARVVVVGPDRVEQRTIPFPPASANRREHHFEVDLGVPDGPRVRYVRRPHGTLEPPERALFSGEGEEREERVEAAATALFGPYRGALEFESSDLDDLSEPVEFRFELTPEQVGRPAPGSVELPATFDRLELLRTAGVEASRRTDLLLGNPWSRETVIDYRLAEGQAVLSLPDPVELEGQDAAYSWRAEEVDGGVRVSETFELRSNRV